MTKRVNSQGTVHKMKNGRWRWELTLGYRIVNGKNKRDSVSGTARTRAEAETALAAKVTQRDRGMLALPDRVTVAEFAETWLERQPGLSKRSIATYRKELSYALEVIGKVKVRDVRAPELKSLMKTLAARVMGKRDENGIPKQRDAETMSGRTLSKVLTRLRALFREAVHDQIIFVNPCDSVKKPKTLTGEKVGIVLDFDEKTRFHELGEALYAAGVCALWPAIFMALSVGLRRSEVMGLRWEDIDFEAKVFRIRFTAVQQEHGTDRAEVTKTPSSRREIEMPASLIAMLKAHQGHQNLECEKARDAWQSSGAVFTTALGAWISPDNLNRALGNILKWSDSTTLLKQYESEGELTRTARKEDLTNLERRMRAVPSDFRSRLEAIVRAGENLPKISPHGLRHTYATLALRSKIPVAVVSKTLGHGRISITMDTYRHVLPSEMKENVFDMFAVPMPVR
jgi:integrase